MAQAQILIVDDEPDIRELIKDILEDEGFDVLVAEDGASARGVRARTQPEVILLDVWMPDIDGISLLKEWQEAGVLEESNVVMISGHGTVETAVEATRLGAWDFIEKPLSIAKLLLTVNNALEARRLKRDNKLLRQQPSEVFEPVGRSPAMQDLRRQVERLAGHSTHILIHGEAGTGKESLARLIHSRSQRAGHAFIRIDCSLLTEGNWQASLMGESGGQSTLVEPGTVFLDNVEQLPLVAQRWLHSVLEGRVIPTNSGQQPLQSRLMAACEDNLEQAVSEGRFLDGLYFHLNAIPLRVPALREHAEDVPELLRFYAEYFPHRDQLPYRPFAVAAQNRLRQYEWPGNLRELRNLVQRLLLLGGNDEITQNEVEAVLQQTPAVQQSSNTSAPDWFAQPLREAREHFEREYLTHHLHQCGGSVGKLADQVGMERTHLYRKLRALSIDPKHLQREERKL
jgi:DNA-binding NtrC family response regulator